MNEVPLTIQAWLAGATHQLAAADIPSAKLDAELLLADALGRDRTWLVAHATDPLTEGVISTVVKGLERRLAREPIAYIRGHQAFYGRDFLVTPDCLIPRPETETLITIAKSLLLPGDKVLDIGTGSGCIAISIALECPTARVDAIDVSAAALYVAQRNVEQLAATVTLTEQDFTQMADVTEPYSLIVANLPYVDEQWERSPETAYEPAVALFADEDGLELIFTLLRQAPQLLRASGHLLLEADKRQHDTIIDFAVAAGWTLTARDGLIITLQR